MLVEFTNVRTLNVRRLYFSFMQIGRQTQQQQKSTLRKLRPYFRKGQSKCTLVREQQHEQKKKNIRILKALFE